MGNRKYLKLWNSELDAQQKKIDSLAWVFRLFRSTPPDLRKTLTFVGYPSNSQLGGLAMASSLLGEFGVQAVIEDAPKV